VIGTIARKKEDHLPEYALIVGDSWAAKHEWHRLFPDKPFVGLRFDGQEVVVVFEPRVIEGVLQPVQVREIRQLFERVDDTWIDDEVFIARPLTLAAAHRLARRVVMVLRPPDTGLSG
jgi:hypothetical protein